MNKSKNSCNKKGAKMKNIITTIILFLYITALVFPQSNDLLPRVSPNASISQTVGYTNISISYCRPAVKGRIIWGSLVPYNQVWRTGANEATTIQFSTDVIINKVKIPAGSYSLFTIPTEKEWTIILNKTDKQWGSFGYKEADDIVRLKAIPTKTSFNELLQISFSNISEESADIVISWEYLQVAFTVETDLVNNFLSRMKENLALRPNDFQIYAKCAEYAVDHNFLLTEASEWADKAITLGANAYFPYYVKAKILLKNNKPEEALKLIEKCRELGRNDRSYNVSVVDLLEKQVKEKIGK